jgi:hypothetical protein
MAVRCMHPDGFYRGALFLVFSPFVGALLAAPVFHSNQTLTQSSAESILPALSLRLCR